MIPSGRNVLKYKINFTSSAECDLFEIYKYVFINDSEHSAEKIFNKLYQKCLTLKQNSLRDHIPPELKLIDIGDFLEIHSKPYRIIYQILGEEIFIHCILDGRRELSFLLKERLLREV